MCTRLQQNEDSCMHFFNHQFVNDLLWLFIVIVIICFPWFVIVIYCQVRVRIIEGRQLSGGNISPVVRVTVANQSRQTRVKKSTNKPLYDEVNREASFFLYCPPL